MADPTYLSRIEAEAAVVTPGETFYDGADLRIIVGRDSVVGLIASRIIAQESDVTTPTTVAALYINVEARTEWDAGGIAKTAVSAALAAERDPLSAAPNSRIWVYGIDPTLVSAGDDVDGYWVVKNVSDTVVATKAWEEDK